MITTFFLLITAGVVKMILFVVDYGLDEAIKQKDREEKDDE